MSNFKKVKSRLIQFFVFNLVILLPLSAFAVQLNTSDKSWGGVATFVQTLFTGDPAIIVSFAAFFFGIFKAITSNHKLIWFVGGIMVAVAIHLGPDLLQGLTGAVI